MTTVLDTAVSIPFSNEVFKDKGNARATNDEHEKQPDLLDGRHVQRYHDRKRHNKKRHISNGVRHRCRCVEPILVDAGSLKGGVPGLLDGPAGENKGEGDGHAVSYHNSGDDIQGPAVDLLHADDAVVEDDEGGFGEPECGNVDDAGSEDSLCCRQKL